MFQRCNEADTIAKINDLYDKMVMEMPDGAVQNIIAMYADLYLNVGNLEFAIACDRWIDAYARYLKEIE